MIGNNANEQLSVLLPRIDGEIAKLFEDRNALLTDGGTITFTGTQVQFSEALKLTLNQKVSGAVPQVISLGSTSQNFVSSGDMMIAVIDRTAGTATVSIITAGNALPAVSAANQEVFLIAKRVDAGDGTQRLYFRNGAAFNAGQSARLGSAGSGGSGSGVGDDLDSLLYRASFTDLFTESSTNANSSINSSGTNAVFNAAKAMYTMSYDASKTVSTTGTAATASAAPAFTVAAGDVIVSGGVVRKIASISSQTSYTLEAAFPTNLVSASANISQAVYTKDIYNFAVDGAAISAAFGASTFSDVLVDYKDNSTANSNIFTPNTTPVIGFVASNDNTNFTTVGVRNTNETDTENSTSLLSAGTSLYLRFFANQTSGSGISNLIMYKAFMQKTTSGTSGGIANSAYAFTNSVGTPINCTVGSSGGKTSLQLTWQYAVGVYAGTTASAIEVWVNGQKIPRFVNSTLTPDASFTELSSTSILLDRDYSKYNLSVEVFQRTQIVDNSTINTTNISSQQEIMTNGFQSFISQNSVLNPTTTTGVPAAGAYYSQVSNRAAIPDLSQDLKARMGEDRILTQVIYGINNEFGSSGEQVWGSVGDLFGQVRFVGGNWANVVDTNGNGPFTNVANDYVEVVFYGTGLNMFTFAGTTGRDIRVTVDGGTEGANIYGNYSAVAAARGYNTYQQLNLVSGLTLGVHTVKLRNNSTSGITVYGFNVLTETTAIAVNPGVSYVSGQKLSLASQVSSAYASSFDTGTLGSRGGRVLIYQKSDGTIGKALNPVGSQLNMTAADHSNEEAYHNYYFREFGANRSDDFSAPGASVDRAFTLEDGITAMVGRNISNNSGTNQADGAFPVGTGNFITFTFVGTGCDLTIYEDNTSTADVCSVIVDGTTIGSLDSLSVVNRVRTQKLVSGLPYGTHTVKLLRSTSASNSRVFKYFTAYQPKKPTLPTGAIELAEYNVMATFVANATPGAEFIGTGMLRRGAVREHIYTGTWNTEAPSSQGGTAGSIEGIRFIGAAAANTVRFYFYGTGFDLRMSTPVASNTFNVTVDGVANLTGTLGATTSFYGNWTSFVGTTGVATSNGTGSFGNGLRVSGLALGLHLVVLTQNAATSFGYEGVDIVTPIHNVRNNSLYSGQNSLPIGSAPLADLRKTTPIKDSNLQTKNVAQAFGTNSSPTTSSSLMVPVPDLSVTHTNKSGRVKITMYVNWATTNAAPAFGFYVDGSPIYNQITGGSSETTTLVYYAYVSPGIHKYDIFWTTASGTLTANGTGRSLLVEEA
jgi:hypothetical protein